MRYILEPLEQLFQWTFGILQWGGVQINTAIVLILAFGLAFWTFHWQKKYNKIAENDPNQIQ